METHVSATRESFARAKAIAGSADERPVLMLNLNRYTVAASFPDGEAYTTYMERLNHSVVAGGGRVLWDVAVDDVVIGCDHDTYDEILAVWYPSYQAFVDLPKADGADLMFASRKECVAHATILSLPGDRFPLQPDA
ncbi:MAG: hypothetical protein ACRBK7_23670 [Acidimicrobiales bacterium]